MIDPRESELPEGVRKLLDTFRENSGHLQFRAVETSAAVFEVEAFYPACCFCGIPISQRENGNLTYLQAPRTDATQIIMPRICGSCGDNARAGGGTKTAKA